MREQVALATITFTMSTEWMADDRKGSPLTDFSQTPDVWLTETDHDTNQLVVHLRREDLDLLDTGEWLMTQLRQLISPRRADFAWTKVESYTFWYGDQAEQQQREARLNELFSGLSGIPRPRGSWRDAA